MKRPEFTAPPGSPAVAALGFLLAAIIAVTLWGCEDDVARTTVHATFYNVDAVAPEDAVPELRRQASRRCFPRDYMIGADTVGCGRVQRIGSARLVSCVARFSCVEAEARALPAE